MRRALCTGFKIDVWAWYLCLVYWLWVAYLATLNVTFASRANQIEAWIFIALQSVLIFGLIITADVLIRLCLHHSLRTVWVMIVHFYFGSLYFDSIIYKHIQIHLGQALGVLSEGGISRLGANWEATGISYGALRNYALGAGGILIILPMYVLLILRFSCGKEFFVKLWSLLLVLATAWLGCGASRWADARRGWDSRFHDLVAAMPLYVGWSPGINGIKLSGVKLRPMKTELPPRLPPSTALPDVFIFFLESTRSDSIDVEATPHLVQFSKRCLPLREGFAASNTSHTSWYSILSANHALYFGIEKRASWHAGSRPLTLLRQLGYRVLTFCSSTLDYHGVDVMAFGSDLGLCDKMFDAEKSGIRGPAERDLAVNQAVLTELRKAPGGRLFLIFYHCTHHDYYWPESRTPKFVPYAKGWKYSDFRIRPDQLMRIKNRYRNAVNFEDSLAGMILEDLEKRSQFNSSVILATGDHGEEFLEHEKLLHASNLYCPQTRVPFLLHFPRKSEVSEAARQCPLVVSHVDLLPTLLDYLGVDTEGMFDGQSLFQKQTDQVLVVAQNGDRDPVQFCIRSSSSAAFFQYSSDTEPLMFQRTVFLSQLTDALDRPQIIDLELLTAKRLLGARFGEVLRSLFPSAGF